jgi:hypothetical protein
MYSIETSLVRKQMATVIDPSLADRLDNHPTYVHMSVEDELNV